MGGPGAPRLSPGPVSIIVKVILFIFNSVSGRSSIVSVSLTYNCSLFQSGSLMVINIWLSAEGSVAIPPTKFKYLFLYFKYFCL